MCMYTRATVYLPAVVPPSPAASVWVVVDYDWKHPKLVLSCYSALGSPNPPFLFYYSHQGLLPLYSSAKEAIVEVMRMMKMIMIALKGGPHGSRLCCFWIHYRAPVRGKGKGSSGLLCIWEEHASFRITHIYTYLICAIFIILTRHGYTLLLWCSFCWATFPLCFSPLVTVFFLLCTSSPSPSFWIFMLSFQLHS